MSRLPVHKPHMTRNPANIPPSRGPGENPRDQTLSEEMTQFRNMAALQLVRMVADLCRFDAPPDVRDGGAAVNTLARDDFWANARRAAINAPPSDPWTLRTFQDCIARQYQGAVDFAVGLANRSREIAKCVEGPMRQLRELLPLLPANVAGPGFGQYLRCQVDTFFCTGYVLTRGLSHIVDAARRNGSGGDQFVQGKPLTVNEFLDEIVAPAAKVQTTPLGRNVNAILDLLATRGWEITAGIHRSDTDAAPHATIRIDGVQKQYHFRVNPKNVLYQITQPDERYLTDPRVLNSMTR